MALLVQAEQQVSLWCVLPLNYAVNIDSKMLFSAVVFVNLSYSQGKTRVLAKFETFLLLMRLAHHMAKTCCGQTLGATNCCSLLGEMLGTCIAVQIWCWQTERPLSSLSF